MSESSIILSSDPDYPNISSSSPRSPPFLPPSLSVFLPESSPPTSPTPFSVHTRLRTSWVYKHMPAPDTEYRYFSTTGKEEWRCKYCPKAYSINGGTRVIQRHLLEKHKKTEKSSREDTSAKRQRSIEHALELSQNQSFKRRKLNTFSVIASHLMVTSRSYISSSLRPATSRFILYSALSSETFLAISIVILIPGSLPLIRQLLTGSYAN